MWPSKALHARPRTSRVLKSLSIAGAGAAAATGVLTLPGLKEASHTPVVESGST